MDTQIKQITDKLEKWLDHYLNFEKHPQKNIFWLDTMNYFCEKFGHPELASSAIHIAGSKGKGSVSNFISSILCEAGYNTGLYTSPHIIDFVERIKSARGYFSPEVYESAVNELIEKVNSVKDEELPGQRAITWFELVTVFAFLTFRKAHTDWSIYEVGLGGRLDSTNVIKPKLCCITPIELEHTQFLGDTVEKIAAEKGGIIKENTPVIISAQKPSVRKVFEDIAKGKNAPVIFIDDVVNYGKEEYFVEKNKISMKIHLESKIFKRPIEANLLMLGKVQIENAALAAVAIKTIYPQIDESIIERGLSKTTMQARFETVYNIPDYKDIPVLILDGAHTVNSVKFTMETLKKTINTKCDLLFGCASDKDVEDIAPLFLDTFNNITVTKPGLIKESNLERMEKAFVSQGLKIDCGENFVEKIKEALKKAHDTKSSLLVTGSFYLVSEVKKIINNQ